MIPVPKAESELMAEHNVLAHVEVPAHVLAVPEYTGLTVKGSHDWSAGSFWD